MSAPISKRVLRIAPGAEKERVSRRQQRDMRRRVRECGGAAFPEESECFTLSHYLSKRFFGRYDFIFNGNTETSNIRLKWLSICFNINYIEGSMELFLNGEPLLPKKKVSQRNYHQTGRLLR